MNVVLYILIGIGCFFTLLGTIGLHRFPDFYTRLHAATKCTTFGAIFLVVAVIVQSIATWTAEGSASPESVIAIHSFVALIAIVLTNATGAHAIARAGHRSGVKPARAVVDDIEGAKIHD